ncbi:separin isoform X1 [Anguilla rostrata]|uniref:separin isoform X1 n=1 Tax=Anguilla rostrata TaxID=7938 RepID=UPI0030D3A69D
MKCLKVEDYVRRTACPDETRILCRELESFVKNGLGAAGRTVCDRVIRACNERLGAASLSAEHLDCLMGLVELALRGYDSSTLSAPQCDPLYMEKILFHVLKKVATRGSQAWCQFLGDLLYDRLALAALTADRLLLAQSCFAVLWSEPAGPGGGGGGGPQPSPDRWIANQLKTLRFLLLQQRDPQAPSKVAKHAEDALTKYAKARGVLGEGDARHLLEQVRLHLLGPRQRGEDRAGWPALCEVSLSVCRLLGQAGLWDLAAGHLERDVGWMRGSPCLAVALDLARRATEIHRAPGGQRGAALTTCARGLRALPAEPGHQERHAVLQGCQLVAWVLEVGQYGPLGGSTLLAWFSFLEGYQEFLEKHIQMSAGQQMEQKHYHTLCCILQQSLVDAYESLEASQLEEAESLERVLLYCQSAASRLVDALRKLANDSTFAKAVSAINSVVRGLHNRKLYDQAFSLAEILCQELRKDRHPSLPVEKLNRTFMLAVLCSRRAGRLEQALDWVGHWLRALGGRVLDHMAEPVSLWAKIKADAARAGQEDMRLRTLRDGLGQDPPGEGEAMMCLLEEELRAYRAGGGDTAQERYNVLCDLLELCPEGGARTLRRAVYLCDMAQVVCFQDFSEQTDCSAVDFTQEALRLLEEEPETTENSDRLKDHKAQALLWFYVCTLERNLQEAKEREQRLAAAREQSGSLEPLGTNDLDYEDKQKRQDSQQVYESLRFNLMAQSKQCQSLDRALELWRALLAAGPRPAVRSSKQTGFSIVLMGALYKLMGKPLQALESYQLAAGLARGAGDAHNCASSLCQSTRLLLELGAPELAQVQLEQAEQLLQPGSPGTEGPTPLDVQAVLLRAQLCHSTGQVESGVSLLNQVLEKVGAHPRSKAWYLLRAQALQTVGSYLSLGVSALPPHLRQRIADHGLRTADTALDESMKWLCSLVVTLLGSGLYGAGSAGADARFVDQGDNVLLKWQVLSEVLSCSLGVVAVRSHCGTVPEAKARCLEALKLATKLQTLSHCAELLVAKAELELQMAELELSGMDLEQVEGLLDLCTDFGGTEKKAGLKIKAQKGRLPKKASLAPGPSEEEEDGGAFLRTRAFPREPAETGGECGLSASPPLRARPERWLSALGHAAGCACPCCSEPRLGRVVVRWAAARAELTRRLRRDGAEGRSRRLFLAALSRAAAASARLGAGLVRLVGPSGGGPGAWQPSFLHDLTAKIYLRMALSGVEPQAGGGGGRSWEPLESGLAFVGSRSAPELALVRAGLLAAQALASILALASKQGCRPEDLFSPRWAWSPLASPKHKPAPFPSAKKTKEPNAPEAKKAREPAAGATAVPRLKITFPSGKLKAAKASRPPPKSASTPRDASRAFAFDDEVPRIAACTPVPKVRAPRPAGCGGAAKPGPKLQFRVYDESSPSVDGPGPVPAAPKRSTRSRFKVEFSEESDAEADAPAPAGPTRPRAKTAPTPAKPSARAPAQTPGTAGGTASKPSARAPAPRKPGRPKKSTALPADSASSAEDCAPARSAPRRGRPRKPDAGDEEPERMRSIREEEARQEEERSLETSVEELRASDTEEQGAQGGLLDVPDKDFEVLRREPVPHQPMEGLWEIRGGVPSAPLPPHATYPSTGPGGLSLDGVQHLLQEALLSLQHLPPPGLYPQLCGLLALCLGQSDPVATAMLHAQSLGLTARHHMICHLSTRLWKLRKAAAAPDLSARLRGLSLDDPVPLSPLQQRLARLEAIFAFPTVEPEAFPHQLGHEFTQQLQHIPPGVTVCLLSVVSGQFGEMGDTVLLSRLERGSPPITMRIPTAQCESPISAVLQEMDSVQKQQKVLSSVADKAQWWEGRRALDQRIERLLEEMRDILGCWQGLLLPLTSDPRLSAHAEALLRTLSEYGAQTTEETLKAVLSASPLLSPRDLQCLARGLCAGRMEESLAALQEAVSALKDRTEPQGHVVLVLDKYLQKLPWENISCLRSRTVTRMPSLHFLLGHCALKELDPESVLNGGVDPQQVYYVLNPDANLKDTEERFKEWFTSESAWQGVCGTPPSPDQLQEAVATKDLYIYLGHGAGARFLDRRRLLSQELRAAALLFGCSSAALAVRGELEGAGVILNYLMAGCPLVVGNLWDVTDRDIDRFTTTLLQCWLSAGRGAPLLDHMAPSRQATYLKHLIGAAPVVYGLPVSLR